MCSFLCAFKTISIPYKSLELMLSFGVQLSCSFIYLSSIQINICSSQNVNSSIKKKKKKTKTRRSFSQLQSFRFRHGTVPSGLIIWASFRFNSIQSNVNDLSSSNCIHSIKIGKSITVRRLTDWGTRGLTPFSLCVFVCLHEECVTREIFVSTINRLEWYTPRPVSPTSLRALR